MFPRNLAATLDSSNMSSSAAGATDPPKTQYVKLISSDGHIFHCSRRAAMVSGTIRSLLSGPGSFVRVFVSWFFGVFFFLVLPCVVGGVGAFVAAACARVRKGVCGWTDGRTDDRRLLSAVEFAEMESGEVDVSEVSSAVLEKVIKVRTRNVPGSVSVKQSRTLMAHLHSTAARSSSTTSFTITTTTWRRGSRTFPLSLRLFLIC